MLGECWANGNGYELQRALATRPLASGTGVQSELSLQVILMPENHMQWIVGSVLLNQKQ